MDTIAFIIALGVGVVLIGWYALNETRGEDGAAGALAVTAATADDGEESETAIEKRYRIRERVAPPKRAGLRRADAQAAYRMKSSAGAPDRADPEEIIERDKEY
jgi:hypothetical protein